MHKVKSVISSFSTLFLQRNLTMAAKTDVGDNYMIIDVGANLTNKKFNRDVESVIKRAGESGEGFNV